MVQEGLPFTLCKSQGFKSKPKARGPKPIKGYLINPPQSNPQGDVDPLLINPSLVIGGFLGFSGESSLLEAHTPIINKLGLINRGSTCYPDK